MLPPSPPPVLQAPPVAQTPPLPQPDPEAHLLEAYDWGQPLPAAPELKGPAALRYRWLQAAATFPPGGRPADPFPPGRDHDEAEGLRALLDPAPKDVARGLAKLTLRQPGTALALWRWGRLQVRKGVFGPVLRRAWEDRLLGAGPALTRGYALRHALCWALAEHDEVRFAALKARTAPWAPETAAGFQRLFGLLGSPSPTLRLWSLPGLAYQDRRLDQLGATRIWVMPAGTGPLPDLPPGVAWIIPDGLGGQDPRSADLAPETRHAGEALASRLQAAGRRAWFAPSREDMERLGLAWFPILITVDVHGAIKDIRMGDAAPGHP